MAAPAAAGPVFPVGFDDDALGEDLEHLPAAAEGVLRACRSTVRREEAFRPRS